MVTALRNHTLGFFGALSGRRQRVLIADDVPEDRDAISSFLAADGYEVFTVVDGSQVPGACERYQPDLAILDIAMNEVSGLEAMVRMKAFPLTSSVPVIIVSRHCSPDVAAIALDLGAADCVAKPWDAGRMREAIARATG